MHDGVIICILFWLCQTLLFAIFTKELFITKKKPRFLRFLKVPGKIFMTTVKHKLKKKQQSPQRLVDEYDHMSSWNDCWMMRLKAIEA